MERPILRSGAGCDAAVASTDKQVYDVFSFFAGRWGASVPEFCAACYDAPRMPGEGWTFSGRSQDLTMRDNYEKMSTGDMIGYG